AHRQRQPDDVWLAFYTVRLLLDEEAWDHAVAVLAPAMKRAPQELRSRLRWDYVFALYKAGRTLQAYGEVEPRKETFAQLANLLCTDKKAAELETLIALHRPHADGDPDLLFYEARAKVFRKQPAQALPLLQKAHQTQTEQFRRRMYVSSWVQDMLEMGDGLEG